ncbi:hypothetical protein HWC09_gp024 [Lactobacillus phage 3-521]|uniref:Uncharacterized protein n=1 Tax=Lactobacillus phage 3-521 TaxID=2510943 RepID=A0A4Y5FER8_9CAUD|nr:hypothetical protein HWC09_gp024 [Lactobacillus phage 3-521]QBJ03562.1 hypothetical protein UCC3521_0024 [Lactobacillus phage 3-521]
MNIDGYEFSVPEMVQGKVGDMVVRHHFTVDHSDRVEKYLREKEFLSGDVTNKDTVAALNWFNDSVLFFHLGDDISIKYLKDTMGIDYLFSDSDNLQNHYRSAKQGKVQTGQEGSN